MTALNLKKICMMLFMFLACTVFTELQASCVYSKQIEIKELEVGNILSWSTVTEDNNQFFVVQKSVDGVIFNTIGQVRGAGNSLENNNYRYLDISTGEDRIFYRLMQIDFDGNFTHSPTILLNRQGANNFVVTGMSSTLTDGLFSLTLRSQIEEKISYKVKNLKNEVKMEGEAEVINGANMISIDLKDLETGRYKFVMNVKDEEETLVIRKVETSEMPRINYAVKE